MNNSNAEKKIDYIEMPVHDISQAKEFYGAVFGWTFEDYGPEYASFHDGRIGGGFTKERPAPISGLLLVIYAADLPALQLKIKSAGGKIVKDTFSFPGGSRFHFTDPSGNEL